MKINCNIDPYDNKGQFCDKGNSYVPIIFTIGVDQELKAKESKEWASSILEKGISVPIND